MDLKIGSKKIGQGHPLFFIAEAGVNHNGSLELGKQLIDIASDCGADAVKFQSFSADRLNTRKAPKSTYHVQTTGDDEEQTWYELLQSQEISREHHFKLFNYCQAKEIIFLSTPYDATSADLLEEVGVSAFKIASTDTNNLPLLKHIAQIGKPVILSTAMSDMEEVSEAVEAVRSTGNTDVAVLQCTGNYPASLEDSNLRIIETFRTMFECPVGYSDHTLELINPIAATALGANIYEKHITISKTLDGPDHRISLEPEELRAVIQSIRQTESALGKSEKSVLRSELENREKLRKSIVTTCSIKKGQKIEKAMLDIKRPGYGLPPGSLERLIGKISTRDIGEDEVIMEGFVE